MLDGWLRATLKESGIGQAEMARRLSETLGRSIDRAAVNKMVRGGRDIAADELLAISQITGAPVPGSQVTRVPLVDQVAAGRLASPATQIPVEDVPLLAFADLGRGEFFALKVEGDSMDRLSPDGSVIVVNRMERELIPGKAYVFSVRGATTYKLWRPEPARLEPFSTNPANQAIFIRRARDMEVVGRVRRTVLDL